MSGRSPTVKYQLFGKPRASDVQRTHAPDQAGDCEVLSETPWFPEGTGKVLRQQWACAVNRLRGLPWGSPDWRRISRRR